MAAAVCITGLLLVVFMAHLTVTGAEIFHRCGTGYEDFLISSCHCGEAVYIRSAVVGFSEEPNPHISSTLCPLTETTCKRTITDHPVIRNCNENRMPTCWIPGDILWFSSSDKLCEAHQNGNFIHITYDCVNSVLHPEPRVFHQCLLDADPAQQPFTINRCPCHQVIRVHSAEVGFSDQCSQTVDCTMPTSHSEIMNCNGQTGCSINQSVVQYSPPDKLCNQRQDGNFIKITYDCINVFTFRGCRAADNDSNHVFTIDTCQLTGQVIYIHSTYVGFSAKWNATDNPPECSQTYCYKRIPPHREILECNGKHNCSFAQDVVDFTAYNLSCGIANFIWMNYSCVDDATATSTVPPITKLNADCSEELTLSPGALAVIIILVALLLFLLIAFIVVTICLCRRSETDEMNNVEDIHIENVPNNYETLRGNNSSYSALNPQSHSRASTIITTITNYDSMQSSATPLRRSRNYGSLADYVF